MIASCLVSSWLRCTGRKAREKNFNSFRRYASSLRELDPTHKHVPASNYVELERQVVDTLSSLTEPVTSLPLGSVGMIQSTMVQSSSASSSSSSNTFGVRVLIDVLVPGYTALETLKSSCVNALKSIEWIDTEKSKIQIARRLVTYFIIP